MFSHTPAFRRPISRAPIAFEIADRPVINDSFDMSQDFFDLTIRYSRDEPIVLGQAKSLQHVLDPGSVRPQIVQFVKCQPLGQCGHDFEKAIMARKTILRQKDTKLNPLTAVVDGP
jgi:hypothetical protein